MLLRAKVLPNRDQFVQKITGNISVVKYCTQSDGVISAFQLVSPIIRHESEMRLNSITKATDLNWSELNLIDVRVISCSEQ